MTLQKILKADYNSGLQPEVKMNSLSNIYYTTESYLFPMVEEEIGEITGKMKEFLRILLKN